MIKEGEKANMNSKRVMALITENGLIEDEIEIEKEKEKEKFYSNLYKEKEREKSHLDSIEVFKKLSSEEAKICEQKITIDE